MQNTINIDITTKLFFSASFQFQIYNIDNNNIDYTRLFNNMDYTRLFNNIDYTRLLIILTILDCLKIWTIPDCLIILTILDWHTMSILE